MNPSVPQAIIDRAYEDDPASASAEYGAQFRADVESYSSRDAIAACVSVNVRERPPLPNIAYRGFIDPSGGRSDSMTLAIAHRDANMSVIGHQGGQAAVLARIRSRRICGGRDSLTTDPTLTTTSPTQLVALSAPLALAAATLG